MQITKKLHIKKLWYIFAIAFFFSSCKFAEPTIGNFNLQNFSPKNETKYIIEVSVEVNNPNNYNIWLKKGDFDINMGKQKMGHIKTIGKVVLKKNKKDSYTLKGEATLDPGGALMGMLLNGGSNKHVTIKGAIKGGVFIIGKKFDVEFDDRLPSINFFEN
jgi:LEA14-like dessication related protein